MPPTPSKYLPMLKETSTPEHNTVVRPDPPSENQLLLNKQERKFSFNCQHTLKNIPEIKNFVECSYLCLVKSFINAFMSVGNDLNCPKKVHKVPCS